jgi:hypothetical protein
MPNKLKGDSKKCERKCNRGEEIRNKNAKIHG